MTLPIRPNTRWAPLQEFKDLRGPMSAWSPAVDVEETDDCYLVEADLPGVRLRDVSVEVREGELVIAGELKQRQRTGVLRRRTRRTGHFDYRVSLPGDTDEEHVEATLHEGVLIIRMPKTAKSQRRRIEITTG